MFTAEGLRSNSQSAASKRSVAMTYSTHINIDCTSGDQTDWSLYSLAGEAESERLDREAGHDYLPMDVYVDPRVMEEHFQASSIRARRRRIHSSKRHAH
jgi:hypothetical protein